MMRCELDELWRCRENEPPCLRWCVWDECVCLKISGNELRLIDITEQITNKIMIIMIDNNNNHPIPTTIITIRYSQYYVLY